MHVLGKRILLKAVKEQVLGIEEIKYYEVAHIGDEITKINVGDKVFYQMGVKLNIQGEDYQLVNEDEVISIL